MLAWCGQGAEGMVQRGGDVQQALERLGTGGPGQGALQRGGISGGPALLGITGRDLIVRYTHVPPVPDWRLKLLMQFEINEVSGQSGGEVAAGTLLTEQDFLYLEREAFVGLCREQKTIDGILHMLETGKPLRN